jgi:hydrogenase-4 component F
MALALIFLPILLAGAALVVPSNRFRPWLLPVAGCIHLALTFAVLFHFAAPSAASALTGGSSLLRHSSAPLTALAAPAAAATSGLWLALDPPGRLVLLLLSVLFFFCSFYIVGYLRYRQERSNRIFCACLLSFLGLTSLAAWSDHLGLMWVAIEATALCSAPLIYFNHTPRSIEATWKYLLVGSVGIALALLGSFFLAYSSLHQGVVSSLTFEDLLHNAPNLSKPWLHAAFVLLLVGYGTKMGLAPMHTWKPDAYGEAPGAVGALFAGGLTSCAFLAILRVYRIYLAVGEGPFANRLLIVMGLLSMAVAGVFMVGQRDIKRTLAYSSVEHMGILILGVGLGGPATFGALLHLMNNGLAKGVLFLSAGSIHRAYGSKSTDDVRGALRRVPLSGALFLAGFVALAGSPPFGPFLSEFSILNGAFGARRYIVGALCLVFLLLVFLGMGSTVLRTVQGRAPISSRATAYRDTMLTGLPPLALMALVLLLGLYIPGPLRTLLDDGVRFLEAKP